MFPYFHGLLFLAETNTTWTSSHRSFPPLASFGALRSDDGPGRQAEFGAPGLTGDQCPVVRGGVDHILCEGALF